MAYLPYLELVGGLVYLLMAGDLLVRAATALSRKAGIPPMVVGLTVVAFGTSAPELFVSVSAALRGVPGIALGNVVGSNIANVLLVMGIPALIHPIACNQASARRDGGLMLGVSLLFFALCALGPLGRWQGAGLLTLLAAYLVVSGRTKGPVSEVMGQELERVLGLPTRKRMIALFLALGIVGLPLGADLTIAGAVEIAERAGVPNLVIGLTAIALGTSLPELATTLVAAFQRHSDLAIGNVLGSGVFNLLGIMGVTLLVSPAPIAIPPEFLRFDLPIMLAAAVFLTAFTSTHRAIGRRTGILLLAAYLAYLVALFLTRSR